MNMTGGNKMSTKMVLKRAKELCIIKRGDAFFYEPVEQTCSLPQNIFSKPQEQKFVAENLQWKLDIINNSFCLVSNNATSQKLDLKGIKDSKTAKKVLNIISANCFTDPKVAFKVCCMDEAIFNRLAECNKITQNANPYWLASSCSKYTEGVYEDYIRWVDSKEKVCSLKINTAEDEHIEYNCKLGFRVVAFLEPDVKVSLIKKQIGGGKEIFVLTK